MKTEKNIKLLTPERKGGLTVMEAFANRRSCRGGIASKNITEQQLSNLLWAAVGYNRPEMRTAPLALNTQDIDVYAVLSQSVYKYDAANHELIWIADGDYRKAAGGGQDFIANIPVILMIVADYSKYNAAMAQMGFDMSSRVPGMATIDTGIVSQNISIFCAGNGLATIPRAMMDQKVMREVLKLSDSQHLLLNNAVGYVEE